MDPFTQRMLEKAEQRSKTLGISKTAKIPLTECGVEMNSNSGATPQLHPRKVLSSNKMMGVEKNASKDEAGTSQSSDKMMWQFSAGDKENMVMGIEINVTTAPDVKMSVEVQEQDIVDDNDNDDRQQNSNEKQKPVARIRDTSRNRLQRLGALYSNTSDLSSPIHRTEGKFHEGTSNDDALEVAPKKPKQRFNKLAVLANTINQWEDDICHTSHSSIEVSSHNPTTSSESMNTANSPFDKSSKVVHYKMKGDVSKEKTNVNEAETKPESKTKQIKWDPKILNSLEAQGFQRRESNTNKIAYDYANDGETISSKQQNQSAETTTQQKSSETVKVKEIHKKFNQKSDIEKKADEKSDKIKSSVKTGLVSGRTAIFENKSNIGQTAVTRSQKDPTELSLKERMQLFERNKGEALIPKAPFGMAPPINKIRQDSKKANDTQSSSSVKESPPSTVAGVKTNTDAKVRDKVAALVSHSGTISENKIKEEIKKQRNEDMQVIANRFNKQRELVETAKEVVSAPLPPTVVSALEKGHSNKTQNAFCKPHAPPPPPPPPHEETNSLPKNKRRSPGNVLDESKRPRNHLYPQLSDLEIESNGSYSDNDNCTTATMSGRTTVDEEIDDNAKSLVNRRWNKEDAHSNNDNDDNDGCCNESYMDSEDSSVGICNGSLGREIMQVVQSNEKQKNTVKQEQQPQRKGVHYADRDIYYSESSINSSDASAGIDDYLDEALEENVDDDNVESESTQDSGEENNSRISLTSKGTTTSNSFSFKKTPRKYVACQSISEENDDNDKATTIVQSSQSSSLLSSPVTTALTVNQEDDNMVTLVHTVSFYRRQQNNNSNNSTPVRVINREQVLRSSSNDVKSQKQQYHQGGGSFSDSEDSEASNEIENNRLVQEKIKKLLDEVCKQQQVIGQTSQALNLCASTIEFSGSTESVEGERHLLVATHRRQAALDEVQRLRVENSLRPLGSSEAKERGQLTVRDIIVPLRQDYIRKLAADTITGHHLVCLLKYNEHVLATKTVPTLPGLVAVRFPDVLQLNNVYADFRVTLEIYGMTAQREVLPHELKYHININNKKCGPKTPKKKGSDNRLVMPIVQSPAGPNAVRTPALVQYAFAIFSLREIQRTTWTLTQVLGVSPLDGVVHMKVNCELSVSLQHKGFLTMFEDTAGCAWHRRWCNLQGHVLNYWKYPDDEKKKAPIGSIDLYTCITKKVAVAPRDICARLNTLLLECERPAKENDIESFLIKPAGNVTIVRHLLSADTKEERDEWCAFFNKALSLLRAWGRPK